MWAPEDTGRYGAWIVFQGNENTSPPQLKVEDKKLE